MSLRTVNSAILLHAQKSAPLSIVTQRNISTTLPLQRKKRKQTKYNPGVPPFTVYGDTHRLMRGACVNGERYGPLFDKPDYTFLDGRPTPLTPEQMKQKVERRDLAERVMKYLQEIDTVKSYNKQKKEEIENYKRQRIGERLKAKS
ncbi:39S ribosomal protein L52, mitochondrial-like isoform X2 [Mercenaria mercenaria]|nr:39S ribosomal protein L52, mitochondrial-like isoform X2 [Mercenaria mercenaria]